MSIADEKYVAFTTYKKDGTSTSVPVWIADVGGGSIGFTTSSKSWKARRLANDDRVVVQACNGRGDPKPESSELTGSATVVTGGEFETVMAAIEDKYGWQVTAVRLLYGAAKLIGKDRTSDCAIIITIDT